MYIWKNKYTIWLNNKLSDFGIIGKQFANLIENYLY